MKQSTSNLIDEYTNVLSGYVAMYAYRVANLCIKADPISLLGVTVEIEDISMNIEEVALVGAGEDEYKINVYPKEEKNILLIGKGIAMEHAEFKQEMETLKMDDGEELKYIKLTMPEVNEDRKKFMTDAVKVLHDECTAKLKSNNALYMGKLTMEQIGASKEEVEEAKKRFEEVTEMHNKSCEDVTTEKNKEIEDAYKAYVEKRQQADVERKEAEDAEGKQAKNTYKS